MKITHQIVWHTKVLAVLRAHGRALSVCDVLGELRQINPKLAPPMVYRALAALAQKGLIHRLESMKALVACLCDRHQQAPVLSVCDDCGAVEECLVSHTVSALYDVAGQSGFAPTHQAIELRGRCNLCRTVVSA